MTEKKFIKIAVASILIVIATIYFIERDTHSGKDKTIDMYYTHTDKKGITEYKENGTDEFMWYKLNHNTHRIDNDYDKYIIIRFTLDDVYAQHNRLNIRMRNKLVEVYIDGVLIQRNGEVGKGQLYNELTSYYDVSIGITKEYEGKEVELLIETPTRFDATSVENIDVRSATDVYKNRGTFEIMMVFLGFIAIAITGLASLYLYWMRLNFTNKFYRVLVPAWSMLGFIVLTLPYYYVNYPRYEEFLSFLAYTLGVSCLFFILYSWRKTIQNVYVVRFINFFVLALWMGVAMAIVLIKVEIINWSYLHYILENFILFFMVPMFIFGYITAKYEQDTFKIPIRIYWSYNLFCVGTILVMYYILKDLTSGKALNILVFTLIVGMIIFLSYIINLFHANLYKEMKVVISESEVYESIDISRDNIYFDKNKKQDGIKKHEYNNLSVKYVKALINADIQACSLVIKEKPETNEIEVVYNKNTFAKAEITEEEARFYLVVFKKIFDNEDISTVRRGKNIYLGFKQDNLYYFMIISPKEMIGDLKFKALVSYTNSIKNTAYNYVITNYIEKAQSDVIRSFGETIEARISSNNIIGITDKFVEFIARAVGKSEFEVQTLKTASYIKNIGTIIMSDNYVKEFHLKSDAELIEAYKRATYGYDILNKFDDSILHTAAIMSKYQFENYDGSGYLGTKREEIPDESKIIKLAVGMTSALRYEINMDKFIDEIFIYVESEEFEGQFSPYILSKVRANRHLFKESFDLKDKDLLKLIEQQKNKNVNDFIM